jgi:DNA-binding NarL/FixJ family response regulator
MIRGEKTVEGYGKHSPILRVLVADDSENVRRSLCQLLQAEPDIEVICEAADGFDAVQKAKDRRPDLVLMDITMPSLNGLDATRIIRQELPSIGIVILSQHDPRGFKWAALSAGANGYVVKSDAARELIPELRRVQNALSNLS